MVKSLFKDPPDGPTLARWVQGYLRAPTHAAIAAFVGAFAADYRPALTKVDRPTLIVAMRNEWAAQFESLQRSIPRSKLVLVDGVAHGMFLEHPERFNPLVEEFLGSLTLD
jgi:pimeloyl-ACP methyl ester carboxylesterase